jgi:hypothetical protein
VSNQEQKGEANGAEFVTGDSASAKSKSMLVITGAVGQIGCWLQMSGGWFKIGSGLGTGLGTRSTNE